MSMFKLEIALDDAAITDNRAHEIARCLDQVAAKLQVDAAAGGSIRDSNGNGVGTFWFEEDE